MIKSIRRILNSCIEVLEQSGDEKASLNYSRSALQKIIAMNSMRYPERYKTDIKKTLKEAYRVLKPGGRFLCLEFSKIHNSNLNFIYKTYSKIIPNIGKIIAGEKEPYEYLIQSIENFVNQDELIDLMKQNNFEKCNYRDLSGGIVSIHSGWKIS